MWRPLLAPFMDWFLSTIYSFATMKRSERALHALQADIKIFKQLAKLIEEEPINKVMFCCLTNGGAKIQPAKVKYYTIIEEAKNKGVLSVIGRYDKQVADIAFLERVISSVFSPDSICKVSVDGLMDGGTKRVMVEEGVNEFLIAYIGSNEDTLWFMVINSENKFDMENKGVLDCVNDARNVIATILGRYYKLDHRIN